MKIYRQGDVLLVQVKAMPAGSEIPLENKRIVLAHGEVTGHSHAISEVSKAKLWSADAERFLQVLETVALKHEEHSEVAIKPGLYQVFIQSEYSPESLRNVQD